MVSRLRVAVVTHARKEPFFCSLWSRHYGALFGHENLFLYKDGDDWEVPEDARFGTVVSVRFPNKREECDLHFAALFSVECARLLESYDVVLRTDIDEFLVVDPAKGSWSNVFLEAKTNGYLYATGLDVVQNEAEEGAFDPDRPALEQRRNALVRGEYCKPCVITRPIQWTKACHTVEGEPVILSRSLMLFHLAMIDRDLLDRRMTERGDLEKVSYRSHANWRLRLFDAIKTEATANLDEADAAIRARLSQGRDGQPRFSPVFKSIRAPDGSIRRRWLKVHIPDRFSGSIPAQAGFAVEAKAAGAPSPDTDRLTALRSLLRPERQTVIVDIGASGIETPPYAFLLSQGACQIWGFEPQPEEFRKLVASAGEHEKYLPHAVGDGTTKRFYITRNPGFSSTLVPNRKTAAALKRWKSDITLVSQINVETVRLDDIAALPQFDLLKIDIQGGEVAVFENGPKKLSQALAVIAEIAAIPIYENQPLLSDQMQSLGALGLQLHKFAPFRSVPFRGTLSAAIPKRLLADQLTDGDAIFVRNLLALETMPIESLKHLAILADFVFNSPSLALRAVEVLMGKGEVDEAGARHYAKLMNTRLTGG